MKCENGDGHRAQETIRGRHVCRPCARDMIPTRKKRYIQRQAAKVVAEAKKREKAAEGTKGKK